MGIHKVTIEITENTSAEIYLDEGCFVARVQDRGLETTSYRIFAVDDSGEELGRQLSVSPRSFAREPEMVDFFNQKVVATEGDGEELFRYLQDECFDIGKSVPLFVHPPALKPTYTLRQLVDGKDRAFAAAIAAHYFTCVTGIALLHNDIYQAKGGLASQEMVGDVCTSGTPWIGIGNVPTSGHPYITFVGGTFKEGKLEMEVPNIHATIPTHMSADEIYGLLKKYHAEVIRYFRTLVRFTEITVEEG